MTRWVLSKERVKHKDVYKGLQVVIKHVQKREVHEHVGKRSQLVEWKNKVLPVPFLFRFPYMYIHALDETWCHREKDYTQPLATVEEKRVAQQIVEEQRGTKPWLEKCLLVFKRRMSQTRNMINRKLMEE